MFIDVLWKGTFKYMHICFLAVQVKVNSLGDGDVGQKESSATTEVIAVYNQGPLIRHNHLIIKTSGSCQTSTVLSYTLKLL